jgi:hypothetical protein
VINNIQTSDGLPATLAVPVDDGTSYASFDQPGQ